MNYAVSSRRTPHILHLITCPLILFITLIMIWWLLWGENSNDGAREPGGGGKRRCLGAARCPCPATRLPAAPPPLLFFIKQPREHRDFCLVIAFHSALLKPGPRGNDEVPRRGPVVPTGRSIGRRHAASRPRVWGGLRFWVHFIGSDPQRRMPRAAAAGPVPCHGKKIK